MKRILILTALCFACVLHAQNTDYRNNALKGAAVEVNKGITTPQLLNVVNDTTTVLFVKFYDQLTQPFSTSVPVLTIMVPASSSFTYDLTRKFYFQYDMWIRVGKGVLDADTTWNKWKSFPPIVEITY